MKTPKPVYPTERIIYHPELSSCVVCGGPLKLMNTLLWDKTVQTLDGVRSVASRPACCADPACPGAAVRVRSAAGQQVALPHHTYGYDVLARIGWVRQMRRATYADIHAELRSQIQISETQVRYLYHNAFLPLLACHERRQADRLTAIVAQTGGLVVALDGMAPEGGEPQLWLIHELLSGVVLRCGWLSSQDQATFEAFVQPLCDLPWPIRAMVSDKQRGLVPAIATVLPTTPHQFCQTHYLRNLVEPLATADSALTVTLRKAVRQELGPLLRQDQPPDPAAPGVLTMTGLLHPSPLGAATPRVPSTPTPDHPVPVGPTLAAPTVTGGADTSRTLADPPSAHGGDEALVTMTDATTSAPAVAEVTEPVREASDAPPDPTAPKVTDVLTHILRRVRYLLTLKGRPPLRLAGIELVAAVQDLITRGQRWLAHRHEPLLADLVRGLQNAVDHVASTAATLQCEAGWLAEICAILSPVAGTAPTAAEVAQQLQTFLDTRDPTVSDPQAVAFQQHLRKVSASYWSGLFHCYDDPTIPRTNNGVESRFRDTQRRLLRTTGQKGRTRRILHRSGAWELLNLPPTETETLDAIRQIAPTDHMDERQRLHQHHERFRLHTRSPRQTKAQLDRLEQEWLALPPTATA